MVTYIVFDGFGNVTDRMDDALLAMERRRERCAGSRLYHLVRRLDRLRFDDAGRVTEITE